MRSALLISTLLLPLQVFALEYRNLSLLYTDAPFIPAEAAGISLLTSLNAVQGNPDGTFRPNRTVNRAEFLKIVLASYPKVRVSKSDAANCFPDVSRDQWFSQYVCLAKKRGMVSGYPDGEFKPGRSVNYAEALKILSELYNYVAYTDEDEEWYAGYLRAAQWNKTALPASLKFDRPLTRGQMARLAAAYRANEEGELETYRLAEKSLNLVVAKEIAERAEVARKKAEEAAEELEAEGTTEAEEGVEAEESITEPEPVYTFPARSRFLLLGSREVIASALFLPRSESARVRNITVKFRSEVKNIRSLYLVDEDGQHIAELSPDTFDKNELTWKAQEADIAEYIIPVSGKELGLEALLQDRNGGFAEELLQVKWISMHVSPVGVDEESYQIVAAQPAYPAHQTVQAQLLHVHNNKPPIVDMQEGEDLLLAEFEIAGEALDGALLHVNHLTFTMETKQGVLLRDFSLGSFGKAATVPCSLEDGILINCLNITEAIGGIEDTPVLFQLWGTVDKDDSASSHELRIDLSDPGRLSTSIDPGRMGHVRWTDGTGVYNWTEFGLPIAEGSTWK